jgi:osmotically-inducible protein OsmY
VLENWHNACNCIIRNEFAIVIYQPCNRLIAHPRKGEMKMKKAILMTVLMVFGLALFSGCAMMTGETAGEHVDDSSIYTQASAIVVQDPDAHYLKVEVTVTKGEVVLTGFVNSTTTENRLVSNIKKIKGVKSVKNLLKVEKK